MSFVYKNISPSDISVNPITLNKKFLLNPTDNGITIYSGENNPITRDNPFDPENDTKTSNNEYKRLIFESIKHLYYHKYYYNKQFSSSLYEDYPQTTLYSGSIYSTTIRELGNITSSIIYDINNIYDGDPEYDNIYNYDEELASIELGNTISVLSFDKDIYGNSLKPSSFIIQADGKYIRDDGEGNVFDYINEDNYILKKSQNRPGEKYIGNIFYGHGIVTILDNDYRCLIGVPPTAINDTYTYYNTSQPSNLDILHNDYSECGVINPSSLEIVDLGTPFPDYYISDNKMYIIENQNSFIPGEYKIGYTIKNDKGLLSNTGIITLNILSNPLQLILLSNNIFCGDEESIDYKIQIMGGVPEYSYSFDNINYTPIEGFYDVIISGSTDPSNKYIYVKDYIGNVESLKIFELFEFDYSLEITPSNFCSSIGSYKLISNNTSYFKIDGTSSMKYPGYTYNIPIGSHYITLYNEQGCNTTINFEVNQLPHINIDYNINNPICDGFSGSITLTNIENGFEPYDLILSEDSISGIDITINDISLPLTIDNLKPGGYLLKITDSTGCYVTSSLNISNATSLVSNVNVLYTDYCSPILEISSSGGNAPYEYNITTPNSYYQSDLSTLVLYGDNLNPMTASIQTIDSNGCFIDQEIYIEGRNWVYSGSYCEVVSGSNTGYVINPYLTQIFTTGINSGSIVGNNIIDLSEYTSSLSLCNNTSNAGGFSKKKVFSYKIYNPSQCTPPTASCIPPEINFLENTNCSINSNFEYNIEYYSYNAGVTGSILEISRNSFFNPILGSIPISTSLGTNNLNINLNDHSILLLNNTQPVFFRIKQNCGGNVVTSNIDSYGCVYTPTISYIFLHYSSNPADVCNTSISNAYNPLTDYEGGFTGNLYYTNNSNFSLATQLWINITASAPAIPGYYTNGNLVRYWNGNNFTTQFYCI